MAHRETIIDSPVMIAGVLVVILVVIAFLLYITGPGGRSGTADIEVPKETGDVAPAGQ